MHDIETDITVSAIAQRDDHFLMIREATSTRVVLNLPGGHIERGETPEQAVVREAMEETRWRFTPTAMVGAYMWFDANRAKRYLRLIYCGHALSQDEASTLDEGILSVHWLSRDEIGERAAELRAPVVINSLDDYLSGKRESGQLQNPNLIDPEHIESSLRSIARRL